MSEKGKNKIDIEKIDLEKEKEKITENPGLLPYAHHLGGFEIKPIDKGKVKGRAMSAMQEQTNKQMSQLYKQMQTLVDQASEIKKRVEVSERIYGSEIPFEPLVGREYFLYEKSDGKNILSMVSPEEWGKNHPYKDFIAKVSLLSDHTWEVIP